MWQNEKDFTLEVPFNSQNSRVYSKGQKGDVPDASLFHQKNKKSKKVMVSACISWYGATKPFFVSDYGMKVNAVSYQKHLDKQLIPEIDNLVSRKDWVYI